VWQAGYLTPASIGDVPLVHLPMRFTQASDFVLAKLLRFTGLTEEEVMSLPEHPELIKKHRLSWLLGRYLAPADILAIRRFLRREGLSSLGKQPSFGKRQSVARIVPDTTEEGEGTARDADGLRETSDPFTLGDAQSAGEIGEGTAADIEGIGLMSDLTVSDVPLLVNTQEVAAIIDGTARHVEGIGLLAALTESGSGNDSGEDAPSPMNVDLGVPSGDDSRTLV
jgi:hypothetical protein